MLHRLSRAFLACTLLALLGALAFAAQDETVQNFRKYFKTYKVTAMRVEAVLTLEGIEHKAVVDNLVPILKDSDPDVVRAAVRVLSKFQTPEPVAEIFEVLKSDKNEAVRIGLLRVLAEGKYAGGSPAAQVCLSDKSWEVRRRAMQVIAAAQDASAAEAVVPLCDDSEPAVRGQAVETLTALNSPLVIPKACALIGDGVWQVRTAAIAALTKQRHQDAIEPLVARLQVEEGRLVPEILEALANLTGNEFTEPSAWRTWWDANKAAYKLPTAEAIAYLRGSREVTTGKSKWNYQKSGVAEYHGIETPSRSMLFVIDVSGSMEAEVVEKERFSDGNYPSYQRIDIVKTELARTIERLESYVQFNVISFATKIDPWKKGKLVPANVLNKSSVKDWIKGLVAIGGASKEDLASVGLTGTANLEMGKTNTYGAIMAALGVDQSKISTGGKDYRTDVDTIFFLSDGRPTVGDFVDPADILREIRNANELRKIVIHTIAIGEFQKDFMRAMAEQNGGVFVDLGK